MVSKTILLGLMIVVSASICTAQSDYKKFEFFTGYSHNRVDTGIGDDDPALDDVVDEREGFHGFNVAATGNFTRYLGLKGDFSAHFKSQTIQFGSGSTQGAAIDVDSRLMNFLGGIQIKDNSTEGTFKPFAHALAGVAHGRNRVEFNNIACIAIAPSPCTNFTETDTGFAGAFGGGIDIRLNNRVDIRAIQFDYNPTKLFDSTQHNFRIGVGIVFH